MDQNHQIVPSLDESRLNQGKFLHFIIWRVWHVMTISLDLFSYVFSFLKGDINTYRSLRCCSKSFQILIDQRYCHFKLLCNQLSSLSNVSISLDKISQLTVSFRSPASFNHFDQMPNLITLELRNVKDPALPSLPTTLQCLSIDSTISGQDLKTIHSRVNSSLSRLVGPLSSDISIDDLSFFPPRVTCFVSTTTLSDQHWKYLLTHVQFITLGIHLQSNDLLPLVSLQTRLSSLQSLDLDLSQVEMLPTTIATLVIRPSIGTSCPEGYRANHLPRLRSLYISGFNLDSQSRFQHLWKDSTSLLNISMSGRFSVDVDSMSGFPTSLTSLKAPV